MRKRKMYLSVEDIAELFGLSVSFAYRVVERMNADLESKNYYVILGRVPTRYVEDKGLFSMIDDVQITNSHIMVAGSMAVEDEGTKIVVYDYDGNQLLKLGGEDISSPDKLGSITGMAETENGFVAADGNMREIQFWAKDGTHVGAISTEDIFGVSYPWLEDMQLLDDGSLLIMLTQERDDGSANELMFFRLTGF